jgi:hypothetical protein
MGVKLNLKKWERVFKIEDQKWGAGLAQAI